MSTVGIVSVIYEEPEWAETKKCIERCNVPTVYVDRGGVGSLAKALNEGYKTIVSQFQLDYVWFVTNPVFDSTVLPELVSAMTLTGYDAIHPSFDSDHKHIQPDGSNTVKLVNFVEFTCPIVKTETFAKFRLDELMPYWGHDLDWGYQVRNAGGQIGVHHGVYVKHVYIRNQVKAKPHIKTKMRRYERQRTNAQTRKRLEQKYGIKTWRDIVGYYGK